jgi:enediyne biosynthesis protein E4
MRRGVGPVGWAILAALSWGCVEPRYGTLERVPVTPINGSVEWGAVQACDAPVSGMGRLEDSAQERGLDLVVVGDDQPSSCNYIPGGVVAHDMDNDGDVDLLYNRRDEFPDLYANDGTGQLARVEVSLGPMADGRAFYGVAAIDVDGDRLPEIFRVGDGFLVMSRNLGDLRFSDWEVIHDAPEFPRSCHASVTFGDPDADGDLDLVLPGLDEVQYEGQMVPDANEEWTPALDLLFENTGGDWVFDRTLSPWGDVPGFSLIQAFTDHDNDGDLDLMSCTDRPQSGMHPPQALWQNDGSANGLPLGADIAPDVGADTMASAMGLGISDINQDGLLDYCMSDVAVSLTCLLSDGAGGYYDAGPALGFTPQRSRHPEVPDYWDEDSTDFPQTTWVSWGIALLDLDNDGWNELAVTAGPPPDAGSVALSHIHDWQPDWLWRGTEGGGFEEVDPATSDFFTLDLNYGLVSADLDGDGYRELITSPFEGRPRIFNNPCGAGSWLEVDLIGPDDNTEAYGALVTLERPDWTDMQEMHNVHAVGQSPSSLHFGLGNLKTVPRLTVRWVDGSTTVLEDFAPNRHVTISHPDAG